MVFLKTGGICLNYREWFDAIDYSARAVLDFWIIKVLIAVGLVVLNEHGNAFAGFIALIFVDLLTKWVALSYKHLADTGKTDDELCYFCCIANIPAARRAGYIKSSIMKHRFTGKIVVYIVLTILAVGADNMLAGAGESRVILRGMWSYLAISEAMSILENMQQSGVEQATGLLGFLKSKFSMFITDKRKKEE